MLDAMHVGDSLLADGEDLPEAPVAPAQPIRASSQPQTCARPHDKALRRQQAAIELVCDRVLQRSPEFRTYGPGLPATVLADWPAESAGCDYLLAAEDDPHCPDDAFRALRWGGQFVYASRSARRVTDLAGRFVNRGFELEQSPARVRKPVLGLVLPLLSRPVHYFVARKVQLTLPKEINERFTYHVQLSYDHQLRRHVVVKEIPSVERVSARLRHKFPQASEELIEKRARKFTEKVFPLFLTREAAMLKLLARDLPPQYRGRVPHLIDMEQDGRGLVRRMRMTWLRNSPPGGRPISQVEFARQAADLLRAVHDDAGIIHLDLRLDNMVVTEQGVGFVDFGSAVRVGENIEGNPLLNTIFDELMRTSQIQRMLEKMMVGGMVTNRILNNAYGKIDKGVDLFYLALQINKPLANVDFRGLVRFDRQGSEAGSLAVLTNEVLKPRNPTHPAIRTAADLLAGVQAVVDRAGPASAVAR